MLIYERDPRQRQLPQLYTPQEPRRVMPSELAEEIILTHPAQPFGASFNEIRQDVTAGTLASTFVGGVGPGPDRYLWVHAVDVSHDDPVDRDIRIGLSHTPSGNQIVLLFELAVPAGQPVALNRTILVPRNFQVFGRASGMAAGQQLTIREVFLDLLEAEMPPYL